VSRAGDAPQTGTAAARGRREVGVSRADDAPRTGAAAARGRREEPRA
jgi:hypothetical protein